MPSLRDIKRRIRSVTNTQQITRAMKMVAAAKLRRSQRSLFALRPYAESLDRLRLEAARRFLGHEHPLLQVRPERRVALLVLTSDKGLCGSFNHNLVRAAEERLEGPGRPAVAVSAAGTRGARMLRRAGVEPTDTWSDLVDPASFQQAYDIAWRFVRRFEAGQIDAMDVLYARFRSPISQPIRVRRLLPVEPLRIESGESAEVVEPYLFEPDTEALAEAILVHNVAVQMYRAISENQTSEHGARMTAMDNATENAADMIDTLTRDYHRARQQHITRELLDIVGGANALKAS
jgi:F-type H+-transporting ATPase subunit gamma